MGISDFIEELNQPDRVETRHITMSVDMYNEIRYETL
jgi:hypothetical protein